MFLRNAFRATAVVVALAATTLTAACGGTGSGGSSSGTTLTVYSADGLANWYKGRFAEFTKDTGIAVNLVEADPGRWCPGWTRSSPTPPRPTCW